MKRIFKDGKYNHHLKKYRKKIKQLEKSKTAWAVLATGILLNAIYLTLLLISDTI